MPDGNSAIIFCDENDVKVKIINSKTGALVSDLGAINSPFELGSDTINPTFNAYNNRIFLKRLISKLLEMTNSLRFGVEMIPATWVAMK